MFFRSGVALAAAALATTSQAAPMEERQINSGDYALTIDGQGFDINYLQTFQVYYANSSAYLGEIKYQTYSEPLIVSGAGLNGAGDGLSFTSIHSAPTGWQEMYVVPHQTQPVGFSVPHGSAPAGVRTSGFAFNKKGNLINNGMNLFYACQNAEDAAINTYQIWWRGAGRPNGVQCQGPIHIKSSSVCSS